MYFQLMRWTARAMQAHTRSLACLALLAGAACVAEAFQPASLRPVRPPSRHLRPVAIARELT